MPPGDDLHGPIVVEVVDRHRPEPVLIPACGKRGSQDRNRNRYAKRRCCKSRCPESEDSHCTRISHIGSVPWVILYGRWPYGAGGADIVGRWCSPQFDARALSAIRGEIGGSCRRGGAGRRRARDGEHRGEREEQTARGHDRRGMSEGRRFCGAQNLRRLSAWRWGVGREDGMDSAAQNGLRMKAGQGVVMRRRSPSTGSGRRC